MKIRIYKNSNIDEIINSLKLTEIQKIDVEEYLKELVRRDKELSDMKTKKYSMSKTFYIEKQKVVFFIRSDNFIDILKRFFIRNG